MPETEQQQQQPAQNYSTIGTLIRLGLIYFFVRNFFGGSKKDAGTELTFSPAIGSSDSLSLRVYITETEVLAAADLRQRPIWEVERFQLPLESEQTTLVTYRPSKAVQNNGSVWLHALFDAIPDETKAAKLAAAGNEVSGAALPWQFGGSWPLNKYLPRPKVTDGVNLLSGKNEAGEAATQAEQSAAAAAPREIINFLKPNITINMIDFEHRNISHAQLQPNQLPWMHLDDERKVYEPAVFFNDFWLLRDYLVPVNDSLSELQVSLTLSSIGQTKWMLYLQTEHSFSLQKKVGMEDNDQDEFKRMLLEGNPYYLALTFAVSVLHSVFDVLAFKNDIGFWKNKNNVEGLSIKTIIINCVCQVIVLLYLLDNDTSFVILASTFVGIIIECWKVTKAMDVSIDRSGAIPRVRFKDKASYAESDTKKFDDEAIKYLSWVLYPCVLAYGVHSLVYKSHKSWYSFVVNTMVGVVYAFGFILMCPQLYLNYKLKSVAHMNHRQMTYKFLSTIVDDLMAFAIRMPTLHRISVFRDDLVFVVFLYQRYIYRVDPTRVNEFGWSPEAPAGEAAQAEGPTAGDAGDSAPTEPTPAVQEAARKPAPPRSVSNSSNEGFEVVSSSETSNQPAAAEGHAASLRQRRQPES